MQYDRTFNSVSNNTFGSDGDTYDQPGIGVRGAFDKLVEVGKMLTQANGDITRTIEFIQMELKYINEQKLIFRRWEEDLVEREARVREIDERENEVREKVRLLDERETSLSERESRLESRSKELEKEMDDLRKKDREVIDAVKFLKTMQSKFDEGFSSLNRSVNNDASKFDSTMHRGSKLFNEVEMKKSKLVVASDYGHEKSYKYRPVKVEVDKLSQAYSNMVWNFSSLNTFLDNLTSEDREWIKSNKDKVLRIVKSLSKRVTFSKIMSKRFWEVIGWKRGVYELASMTNDVERFRVSVDKAGLKYNPKLLKIALKAAGKRSDWDVIGTRKRSPEARIVYSRLQF